jgi:hypothetical protein
MRLTPGTVIENCSLPTDRLRANFRFEPCTTTEARACWTPRDSLEFRVRAPKQELCCRRDPERRSCSPSSPKPSSQARPWGAWAKKCCTNPHPVHRVFPFKGRHSEAMHRKVCVVACNPMGDNPVVMLPFSTPDPGHSADLRALEETVLRFIRTGEGPSRPSFLPRIPSSERFVK